MADAVINAETSGNARDHGIWGPYYVTELIGAVIYADFGDNVEVGRTTDGGATWVVTELISGNTRSLAAWHEHMTPGRTGNILHLFVMNDSTDDFEYIAYNVLTGTAAATVTVAANIGVGANSWQNQCWGTVARNGTIICGYRSVTGATDTLKSLNSGATFTGGFTSVYEGAIDDIAQGFPATTSDDADVGVVFYDDSATEVSVKIWDDSGGTWTETSLVTSVTNSGFPSNANVSVRVRRADGQVFVAVVSAQLAAGGDIRVVEFAATGTAPVPINRTDVITDSATLTSVDLQINDFQALLRAVYTYDGDAYYKESLDWGITWDIEHPYSENAVDYTYARAGSVAESLTIFKPVIWDDTGNDLLVGATFGFPPADPTQYRLMLSDGVDPDIPTLNITPDNVSSGTLIKVERGRESAIIGRPPRAGQASATLNNTGLGYGLDEPTPGLALRLNKKYDGVWYHLWHGNLDLPTHEMTSFRPLVQVRALGVFTKLAGRKVTTSLYQNITVGVAINHLLNAANFPAELRDIDAGEVTLLYWWLAEADPMSELLRLVATEGVTADLYESGDGKIVFRSRSARYTETRSTTIQTTFRNADATPWINDFKYESGYREIVNQAQTPRKTRLIDPSPSVVWSEASNHLLPPNTSITLYATSSEPFTGAITPVLGTDYTVAFGSVTVTLDRTSGSRVGMTFTSGAAGAAFGYDNSAVLAMQLRATSIPQLGTDIVEKQTVDTSASILAYGVRPWSGEMWPEIDWATARDNLDAIVTLFQQPRGRVRISINAAQSAGANEATAKRELGDRIRVIQTDLDFDGELWIERFEHEVNAPAGPAEGPEVGSEITHYECSVVAVAVGSSGTGLGNTNPYDSIDNSVFVIPPGSIDDLAHPAPSRLLANIV